jgi:hypothetical protein
MQQQSEEHRRRQKQGRGAAGRPVAECGRLVEVRAGHVVPTGGVGAEQLALSFQQRRTAVGTHSLRTLLGRFLPTVLASRFPRRGRPHGLGFEAGGGAGVGVAAGRSVFSKSQPAGVRRAAIGVKSGVGEARAESPAPRSALECAFFPQPRLPRARTMETSAVSRNNRIPPPQRQQARQILSPGAARRCLSLPPARERTRHNLLSRNDPIAASPLVRVLILLYDN